MLRRRHLHHLRLGDSQEPWYDAMGFSVGIAMVDYWRDLKGSGVKNSNLVYGASHQANDIAIVTIV